MIGNGGSRGEGARPRGPHDEFLELCALATSGSLTDAERTRLREHLPTCSECRKALEDFESVVKEILPELVPELEKGPHLDPSFSQEAAEALLQKRLK
jgi:anti-sigma factor ChrR (cupin superfamily)